MTFTLLDETRPSTIGARIVGDAVRVPPADVERALGWTLKPQGLCRGEQCIVVPPSATLAPDGDVDLATLAHLLGRPLVADLDERAACLGAAAAERAAALRSLEAPDRKSTRLNSSHIQKSRMPSSA